MARLLHLSDLHVVAPGTLVSGVLDTPVLLNRAITDLLARMEAIGPLDAVLVTGDISDDGSAESYAVARAELERLGLPLLMVPGNHDRREAMREAFVDLPGMSGSGPLDWVADVAGCRVVGLDTLVEGKGGGRLRSESLRHLDLALSGALEDVVIALHHPPIRTGIRFMDAIGLENAADLAQVLSGHRTAPLRSVAGHVHGIHHGSIAGHPVSTAPSLCSAFALDRRDDAPVGFMAGPRGCAVIGTGEQGIWTAIPLGHEGDLHAF